MPKNNYAINSDDLKQKVIDLPDSDMDSSDENEDDDEGSSSSSEGEEEDDDEVLDEEDIRERQEARLRKE